MMRLLLMGLALAAGTVCAVLLDRLMVSSAEGAQPAATAPQMPATLDDWSQGRLELLDLGWPLDAENAYWPGENYRPFELRSLATLEKNGVLSKAFSSPEHLGTHVDAPNHFVAGKPSVDQLLPERLFGPGVVIDVSPAASADADYAVSLADIKQFETDHGPIPSGAIVLAATGWARFWRVPARYQNRDIRGTLHFPGFASEAVDYLIRERNIRGVGIDTLSVDPGNSRDFPVHHLLGQAERFGLENLASLDKLPPRGFYLSVAPMKIQTGTGGPARVLAVWSKNDGGN